MQNKFIVLEGLDGAGKTSICQVFKTKNDFLIIKSPPPPFNGIKQKILENVSANSRFLFFLASNIEISNIVKSKLHDYNIISDRYIFSTLAYHMTLENINLKQLNDILPLISKFFIMPNITFYLTLNREEQIKRCKNKDDDLLQKKLVLNDDFQKTLRKNYQSVYDLFPTKLITIDTSHLKLHEVIEKILTHL